MNYDPTIRPVAEERPIDALIAGYAARTLSAPLMAMVAAHLELKPENRGYAAALEAVHGVFLEQVRPVPLANRDRRLVNIFATPDPEPCRPEQPSNDNASVLPRALRRFAGCDLADLAWRNRGFGVKDAELATDGSGEVLFASVRPGKRLPLAHQQGLVAALLLDGAASDASGTYGRGDIVLVDADRNEAAIAQGDRDCICFIVAESPATGPGKLSRALLRVIGN